MRDDEARKSPMLHGPLPRTTTLVVFILCIFFARSGHVIAQETAPKKKEFPYIVELPDGSLPSDLVRLRNIRELIITASDRRPAQTIRLPSVPAPMPGVRKLVLNQVRPAGVSKFISNFPNLRELLIRFRARPRSPELHVLDVGGLKKLRRLDITDMDLNERAKVRGIGKSTGLEVLSLYEVDSELKPGELKSMGNLKVLSLERSNARRLWPHALTMPNLRDLELREAGITTLPAALDNLVNLEKLSLGDNRIRALPPEIGNLRELYILKLGGNKLTRLPPEIGKLKGLQILELGDNQLAALPPEIGNLNALRELGLVDNKLTGLPARIGDLTALRKLHLFANQIRELHPALGRLNNLRELDLNDNRLRKLPPELSALAGLKTLEVQKNCLTNIPASFKNFKGLLKLDLAANRFRTMPAVLIRMNSLRELILRDNFISEIADGIGSPPAGLKIYLSGNPLDYTAPLIEKHRPQIDRDMGRFRMIDPDPNRCGT